MILVPSRPKDDIMVVMAEMDSVESESVRRAAAQKAYRGVGGEETERVGSGLYGLLEIPVTATQKRVEKAFRRSAVTVNSDLGRAKMSESERKVADEKLRKVIEAGKVLTDPRERKIYNILQKIDEIRNSKEAERPRLDTKV